MSDKGAGEKKRKDISSTSSADSSFEQQTPKPKGPQGPRVQRERKQAEKKAKLGLEDKTQTTLTAYINMSMESQLQELMKNMMTTEKLSSLLDEKLSNLKTDILQEINTTIDILRGSLHDAQVENDKLAKEVKTLKEQNDKLEEKVTNGDNKVNRAMDKLDELEQYGRKTNIRIFGLPDVKKEESVDECVDKVVDLLQKKLGVNIENRDISIAHRMGIFDSKRPRSVIVKFISRRHKVEAIRNRRKLKGSKIVIREDLTKRNADLLQTMESLHTVETAWTREGTVFAKFTTGNIQKITHRMDFSKYQRKPGK